MTTTKEAAGLVEDLKEEALCLSKRAWSWPPNVQDAAISSNLAERAADLITTLLAQVEELRRERDEALDKLGRAIMALPPGYRLEMPAVGIKTLRSALTAAEARATKAEAGIAEAVKVCELFSAVCRGIPSGYSDDLWIKLSIAGSSALEHGYLTIRDFRAARAFVEKHKESGNG